MRETVLVTGGCGFIGSWVLRELLERGVRPVVIDTEPSPSRWDRLLGEDKQHIILTDASLLDRDQVRQVIEAHQVTHLIHLAALLTPACQQNPWIGGQVNVLGSLAVFDAARLSGRIKAISYASSYAVYGPQEADSTESFYGAFKRSVDLIARQYWRHHGIASVAVRPHVVYGPERTIGLTAGPSLACRAAALGEPFTINYTGTIGYDYVQDVAQAFVRAAFEPPAGAVIVDLPSEPASTQRFVDLIEAAAPEARGTIRIDGPAIPTNVPPQPNYIQSLYPDWQPTPLAEGIARTISYYRAGVWKQ